MAARSAGRFNLFQVHRWSLDHPFAKRQPDLITSGPHEQHVFERHDQLCFRRRPGLTRVRHIGVAIYSEHRLVIGIDKIDPERDAALVCAIPLHHYDQDHSALSGGKIGSLEFVEYTPNIELSMLVCFGFIAKERKNLHLQHVNEHKQTQPNDVNEMPIPGDGFESEIALWREMTRSQTQPDHDQHDGADGDVQAVEPGQHVKC